MPSLPISLQFTFVNTFVSGYSFSSGGDRPSPVRRGA
jgi:hypothetical protein